MSESFYITAVVLGVPFIAALIYGIKASIDLHREEKEWEETKRARAKCAV